jgi:hypothetical protein
MCKPSVTVLPIRSDGPCNFSVRSYGNVCAAFSIGWSWRASIANVLRVWADKAEGVQSLTIVARGPSQITFYDVTDAATVGFNGATQYLNDLWRDRVLGSTDVEQRPVLRSGTIR